MRYIVERVIAKFKIWRSMRTNHRRPLCADPQRTVSSARSVSSNDEFCEIDGTRFALTSDIDQFTATAGAEGRACLRLRTIDYKLVMTSLMRLFDSKYDEQSPQYRAFKYATLVCAGCRWEFPGSYRMSLMGMLDSGRVAGATRGFAEFGKSGTCTRCGGKESILVYECFSPSDISEEDVRAIRQYWRDCANLWWASHTRSHGICDGCNRDMSRGEGYFIGSRVECEFCADHHLAGGLEKLRRDPYYFGSSELRKARNLRKR